MSTQLTRVEPLSLSLEPRNLAEAQTLARIAVESRMFAVKSPQEALVILLTGRELGLSAMQAFRSIHVVQGRPVLAADLMVALVRRSPDCEYWQLVDNTAERCTIRTLRKGDPSPTTMTWTMEDAARAKLTGKDNWRMHPAAMLRARCSAALARACYPDLLMGLYTPDELADSRPIEMVRADPGTVEHVDLPTIVLPAAPAPVQQDISPWLARIQAATTEDELDSIRAELRSLPPGQRPSGEAGWSVKRAIDAAACALVERAQEQAPPSSKTSIVEVPQRPSQVIETMQPDYPWADQ